MSKLRIMAFACKFKISDTQ